ncbi:MAG: metallophosphoesterase [Clostridia bacterium]|nr:metallophosphoesterase [Clostridia bacterium]
MKKVFSLCLVLAMMFSVCVPMAQAEEITQKVVVVDNNRTRIEFESPVSVAAGESVSVDFTVPVDGNYAFMANKNTDYYGYLNAELKSDETTVWSVTNAPWDGTTSGKKPYGRVGKGTTGTVALTKDTPYTLTLTAVEKTPLPNNTVSTWTTSYIDVLCTDIVADGKKLVQPYFYKTTGQNGDHFLNNADARNYVQTYINNNMADYTIPGKPADGQLAAGWSFIQVTPMPARTNHIEYDIIAPSAGKYVFKFGGEQYTSGNGPIDETVYIKVDGTHVGNVLYDASSEEDKFQVMSIVLDLTAGHHVVRIQRNTTGTATEPGGTHTYMSIPFVSIEPKEAEVIHASDNLTRIEMANTVVIPSGETKSFDFTVPMDGNYALMSGHPTTHRQFYGNLKAVLTNEDDGTETIICEKAEWTGTGSGAKSYRRIGNGGSGTVALKAGVNYSVALTPTAIDKTGKQTEVGISYIDVLRTDIPVAGDTLIPTQYYTKSAQGNEHFLSNTDCATEANTYVLNNLPKHTIVGKPKSGVSLSTTYTPTQISTILSQTTSMEYTLDVEKAGYYELATRVSVHSGSSVASPDTVYFSVDGAEPVTAAYNPPSYAERAQTLGTVAYLSEGTHTLKVYRKYVDANQNSVMYFMFFALTPIKPEAAMYLGEVAEDNRIYTVENGNMIAQIDTKGTMAEGGPVNAFFAVYDDEKQMVAVDVCTKVPEGGIITLTIPNFKKVTGKTYKAKAFLWNENYWGESFLLAEGLDDLIDFTVTVPEGREAVVLQLTDTQTIDAGQQRKADRLGADLSAYCATENQEARMFKYLRETINATKPDLILLTGDIVYGEFDDNGSAFLNIVNFMESMKIPWAPVFGNHENESAKGADWQSQQLENAEYCLFKQRTLTGNGNYTVGIEQGGELKRVFFMMDSNGCGGMSEATAANGHSQRTAGFANDQVAWFEDVGNKIQGHVPGVKVSFGYHIQMQKFQEAYTKYGYVQVASGETFTPVDIDTHPDKADTDFGYLGGRIADGWDADGTIYNKMKAIGMDSMFIGHLHEESASAIYDGVRFQFGMKSSSYDKTNYRKDDGSIVASYLDEGFPLVGGTVLTVSEEDGSFSDAYIYLCKEE